MDTQVTESEVESQLNVDYNHNLYLAKKYLKDLSTHADRQKAVFWMRKLSFCNRDLQEKQLRNDFMYYLVINIQNGKLCPPFNQDPPPGPLPDISQLLPGVGCSECPESERFSWEEPAAGGNKKAPPFLYSQSPDGGEFLNSQPIPRKGAFCYLAVITRGGEN